MMQPQALMHPHSFHDDLRFMRGNAEGRMKYEVPGRE